MRMGRGQAVALSVVALTALAAASATSGLSVAYAAHATAASDTSPPVWTMEPVTDILPGAKLATDPYPVECPGYSNLQTVVRWRATDPQSGIDHYAIGDNDEPASVGMQTQANELSFIEDNKCGGGHDNKQFYAVNGAGLSTSRDWGANRLGIYQDDGTAADAWGMVTKVVYKGTWQVSTCTCFSGSTTHKTTQSGASATFSFVANPASVTNLKPSVIGLSMPKAPDRGSAAIFVNGVKVATVNNYSTVKANSTIVWRKTFAAGATPTIKVVNLGTTGHPRSDVDAFVYVIR